jgi:hypothetical protein
MGIHDHLHKVDRALPKGVYLTKKSLPGPDLKLDVPTYEELKEERIKKYQARIAKGLRCFDD